MIYIENIFVCIIAPLIMAAVCIGKKSLSVIIPCLTGMGACLISAYLNTFFAEALNLTDFQAVAELAPVIEELVKFLPLLFYCYVFKPETKDIRTAVLVLAAGFATFENICYLLRNGSENLSLLMIRGFSTGAMHVLCGAIVGYGLMYVWKREWLRIAGSFGLLSAAIVIHGMYNLMAAHGGAAQYVAYILPVFAILTGVLIGKRNILKTK